MFLVTTQLYSLVLKQLKLEKKLKSVSIHIEKLRKKKTCNDLTFSLTLGN